MPDGLFRSVGAVVLLLGGLVFVHELGHFLVAKLFGVKVLKFSLGFGPRVAGFQRGETEYRISILPLGGYVKMAGDDPTEELPPEDKGRGFLEQPPWKRFLIALAGPGMNLVFPVLLYFVIGLAGNGQPVPGPTIGTVSPDTPASRAGLQPGDRIVAVDGRPVRYFEDLHDLVAPHPGEELSLTVQRGGRTLPGLTITPAKTTESNPIESTTRGIIGVRPLYPPALVAPVRPGAAGALEPFDLVVKANGKPVKHWGQLQAIAGAAPCAPIDLEVLRERPYALPGATLSTLVPVELTQVPTCAGGKPSFDDADPTVSTFVASVTPGSPAAQAGLVRGDRIAAVNGKPVHTGDDIAALGVELKAGEAIELALDDGRKLAIRPIEQTYVDDATRETLRRLVLGFHGASHSYASGLSLVAEQVPLHRGVAEIARASVDATLGVVRITVLGIARIVQGRISFKTVGGPIMLFSIASQAAEEGWQKFLFTMALISVNLGLLNLFPIPVLDGGHLAASVVEGVTRRPLSLRAREIANVVGLILLLTLMIFVFKNDIARLMG